MNSHIITWIEFHISDSTYDLRIENEIVFNYNF